MSSLKIRTAPSALAEFARKHNDAVEVLQKMRGTGGVKVTVSDSNIIVDGSSVTGTTTLTAVTAVGYNGLLVTAAQHSSAVTPVSYPIALGVVTASCTILMNATGFVATNASGKSCTIAFAGLTYDLSIREITICDSGTAKKMLIIGSAPYT
jgi:hypothetical protein